MSQNVSQMVTGGMQMGGNITGTIMQGIQTKRAGEYARLMGERNQQAYETAALNELQQGADAAAEHRQRVRQILARQNAAFAANGIDSSTGSALQVSTDTAGMGELDALRIMGNAKRKADDLRLKGNWEKYEGDKSWYASRAAVAGTFFSNSGWAGGLGNMIKATQAQGGNETVQNQQEAPSLSSDSSSSINYKSSGLYNPEYKGYKGYSLLE